MSSHATDTSANRTADHTVGTPVHIDVAAHGCVGVGRRRADRRGHRHQSAAVASSKDKHTGDKKNGFVVLASDA